MNNDNLFEKEVAVLADVLEVKFVGVIKRNAIPLNIATTMVNIDHGKIAAMAATAIAGVEEIAKEASLGFLKPINIKADLGNINIIRAGPKVFLFVISEKHTDNGVFSLLLQKIAQEIEKKANKLILE